MPRYNIRVKCYLFRRVTSIYIDIDAIILFGFYCSSILKVTTAMAQISKLDGIQITNNTYKSSKIKQILLIYKFKEFIKAHHIGDDCQFNCFYLLNHLNAKKITIKLRNHVQTLVIKRKLVHLLIFSEHRCAIYCITNESLTTKASRSGITPLTTSLLFNTLFSMFYVISLAFFSSLSHYPLFAALCFSFSSWHNTRKRLHNFCSRRIFFFSLLQTFLCQA